MAEQENRYVALDQLLKMAESKGYVTFDDIMDCADSHSLPIQDFDWLSSTITIRGILVYDEQPGEKYDPDDDEISDFAQTDYQAIFDRVVEICPELSDFIDAVKSYKPPQIHEVGQLKFLIREGNAHARQRMIEMHLRLAVKNALQRAEYFHLDMEETIQNACCGLVIAVDKYDPDENGAFSSYASLYMLQYMSRVQTTQNPHVYYPVHKKEDYYSAWPFIGQFFCANGNCSDCPSMFHCDRLRDAVCQKFEWESKRAEDAIHASFPCDSLENAYDLFLKNIDVFEKRGIDISFAENYNSFANSDPIEDLENRVDKKAIQERVAYVLGILRPRESEVLALRYGINGHREHTLDEIGKIYGLTRERIRQIEAKAMRKINHPSRQKYLK